MTINFSDSIKSFLSELVRINKYNLVAIGYEKITATGTAQGLASIPNDARYCEIRLESDVASGIPVRYLMLNGKTLPTTTDGMALNNLDFFDITGRVNIENFRFIEATSGTNVLHVQYYK